jgi:hypothetical protein
VKRHIPFRIAIGAGFVLLSSGLAHAHGFAEGMGTFLLTFIVVILISQFGLDYLAFKHRISKDQPLASTIFANLAYLGLLTIGTYLWDVVSTPLALLLDAIPGGIRNYTFGAYIRLYGWLFTFLILVALGIALKTGVLRWLFNVRPTWRVAGTLAGTSLLSVVFAFAASWIALRLAVSH